MTSERVGSQSPVPCRCARRVPACVPSRVRGIGGLSRDEWKEGLSMRLDVNVDMDDVEVSASVAKVGGGNYSSWHMQFRFGGSEITFDGDAEQIESLLDQLQHDLMLVRCGASRRVDGVPA